MQNTPSIFLFLFTSAISLILLVLDAVEDLNAKEDNLHVMFEFFIVVALFFQILFLLKWLFRLKHQNTKIALDVNHWREEHQKVLKGVAQTINKQFEFWQLTPSQKEIGLLLLKGLSFQEISAVRKTTERTVRQQATSIYKKAKLKGRHEFAAFFLEDLLLPEHK